MLIEKKKKQRAKYIYPSISLFSASKKPFPQPLIYVRLRRNIQFRVQNRKSNCKGFIHQFLYFPHPKHPSYHTIQFTTSQASALIAINPLSLPPFTHASPKIPNTKSVRRSQQYANKWLTGIDVTPIPFSRRRELPPSRDWYRNTGGA